MAILKWNVGEQAWICSECGAIYGREEVARAFSYGEQNSDTFMKSHCMDCGVEWEECEG